MNLVINGEPRELAFDPPTVGALLEALGLQGRRVAVEVNRRLVTRANHRDHTLAEGDEVEVVHFVGGGR